MDLAKGPGHIESTARPGKNGNVGISGHRTMYSAPFRYINELNNGDLITLETINNKFNYIVTEKKTVSPTDTGILNDFNDYRVTLTTCEPVFSARKRLVVVGILKK